MLFYSPFLQLIPSWETKLGRETFPICRNQSKAKSGAFTDSKKGACIGQRNWEGVLWRMRGKERKGKERVRKRWGLRREGGMKNLEFDVSEHGPFGVVGVNHFMVCQNVCCLILRNKMRKG